MVLRRIPGWRRIEYPADEKKSARAREKPARCGVEASLQVELVFDRLPADLPVFDFVPRLFVGIEFGGVGREKERTDPGAMGADELAHRRRAVERDAIHHEDQRARGSRIRRSRKAMNCGPSTLFSTAADCNSPRAVTVERSL